MSPAEIQPNSMTRPSRWAALIRAARTRCERTSDRLRWGLGLPTRGNNHLNICRYGSPLDGIPSIAFLAKGLACSSVCRLSFGSGRPPQLAACLSRAATLDHCLRLAERWSLSWASFSHDSAMRSQTALSLGLTALSDCWRQSSALSRNSSAVLKTNTYVGPPQWAASSS